jgi:hypothetical protein
MASVYGHTGGQWKPLPGSTAMPDLMYAHLGAWRPVKSVHVYKKDTVTGLFRWHTVFLRVQYPPQNVRGTAVNGMTGATLSWAAPMGSTAAVPLEYQVRQYLTGNPTPVFYPWTRNLSQSFTGLQTGKTYEYEVTVRATAGVQIEETSEPRVRLLTGVPAVHRVGSRTVYIEPLTTDTWSADAKWKETPGGVRQGYASDRSRNAHGVIRYNSANDSLFTNTVNALKAAGFAEPSRAAEDATVVRARISYAARVDTDKAAAAPAIYCYPCLINTGSTASPQPVGGANARATFIAPAPGKAKEDFRIIDLNAAGSADDQDRLKMWAQAWLNKTNAHNGILIEREDGAGNATVGFNGWCAFRGHTYTADWRLEMDLTWDFYYPAATNAQWLPK